MPFALIEGEKYTISAYYKGTGTSLLRIWDYTTGSQLNGKTTTLPSDAASEWVRISYTFTATSAMNTDNIGCLIGVNGTSSVLMCGFKFEKGEQATEYCCSTWDLGIDETIIEDSSGYNHNGTINGTLTTSSDTVRYSSCVYMPKTTTITHQRPIYGGTDQEWTCCMWVKLDTTSQSYQQLNNFNEGNHIIFGANGTPLLYLNSGANDYYNYGNLAIQANTWTHIAFVFKNSNATKLIYINGVNHTNTSGPNRTSTPKGIPDIITVGTNLAGYISDYRVYCTPLLDTDIK